MIIPSNIYYSLCRMPMVSFTASCADCNAFAIAQFGSNHTNGANYSWRQGMPASALTSTLRLSIQRIRVFLHQARAFAPALLPASVWRRVFDFLPLRTEVREIARLNRALAKASRDLWRPMRAQAEV